MNSSAPPDGAVQAVGSGDQNPPDRLVPWLLARAGRKQDIPADTPLTDDQKIIKLARAVSGCVADGCLQIAGLTRYGIAVHVAEHTPAGVLPAWVEEALAAAAARHSWTPVDLSEFLDTVPERDWGPWTLAWGLPDYPVLETAAYEVGLTECTDSAKLLDWICQITHKTWADDATIAGLIRAINDVLNPQANYCSFGQHLKVSRKRIMDMVKRLPYPAGQPPTIEARRRRNSLVFHCEFCKREHSHGACSGDEACPAMKPLGVRLCTCPLGSGDGHRVAHCHEDDSPYRASGYVLKEIN